MKSLRVYKDHELLTKSSNKHIQIFPKNSHYKVEFFPFSSDEAFLHKLVYFKITFQKIRFVDLFSHYFIFGL